MRRKNVSKQILLASRSGQPPVKKDIHAELLKTIAERKRILPDWENLFLDDKNDAATIHMQLKTTIADLKRTKQQYADFFATQNDNIYYMANKNVA